MLAGAPAGSAWREPKIPAFIAPANGSIRADP